LAYIEAVPWSENEEEKLKNLFARLTFDEEISQDILARLRPHSWKSSDDLMVQLIQSVTSSTKNGARKDMQSLVNGLLSKSSVYQKDSSGLNKESLYQICYSCLESLVDLFEEAIESTDHTGQAVVLRGSRPLIERVSSQTENLNWLLDILVNNDMAEEFVELWAKHERLIRMHEQNISLRVHCAWQRKSAVSWRHTKPALSSMVQHDAVGFWLASALFQRSRYQITGGEFRARPSNPPSQAAAEFVRGMVPVLCNQRS
jgi:hypothetical protein